MADTEKNRKRDELRTADLPDTETISRELEHERGRTHFFNVFRSTAFVVVAIVTAVIIVAVLLLPVMRIYGNSMQDTLNAGDYVISVRTESFSDGDIIAFYYNNNILVKRVIAQSGDTVDISDDGTVTVNGEKRGEPYLSSKAYGSSTDIEFPYTVPQGRLFVMGDNRGVSMDSRSRSIGCVSAEQIVGKVVFRIWPLLDIGPL